MTNNPFLDALKASVGTTNRAFDQADKDLHATIRRAAEAVRTFSNERLALVLAVRNDTITGRVYALEIKMEKRSAQFLEAYLVPHRGYPIQYGSLAAGFEAVGELGDSTELASHLLEMMANPDSRLAVVLAYEARKDILDF